MSGGYDLIHCNTPVAGIVTRLVAAPLRRRGTIVVYTAHGFHFYTGAPLLNWIVYYPLERAFAGLTDALITINREDYVRAMKFPSATVHYLPGVGVELQRFETAPAPGANLRRELGLAPDDFVVLSVGELNENKNHATVLRAMAQMKTPVIHYLICGNGPRREELEDLARQTGVSERVHFLGYRRDIPSILASADIFCLPSFREGLPMALMEAMAAGKPLVCSRIRGSVDLVDPGEGGVIVEPSDISGFARAFDRLAADSELRQAMGRHNRERVRAFSTDAVTMALAEVYGLPGSGRGAQ
jgi:glycosyltransferase EpsD